MDLDDKKNSILPILMLAKIMTNHVTDLKYFPKFLSFLFPLSLTANN